MPAKPLLEATKFPPWTTALALAWLVALPVAHGYHNSAAPAKLDAMTAKLPFEGLYETSAVWDGSKYAYIFGGQNETSDSDMILRYDPSKDRLESMKARLPTARAGASAIWANGYAYVFGGSGVAVHQEGGETLYETTLLRDIVRYDPRNDTVRMMSAKLPTARWGTSAATDGRFAYVFGGHDGDYLDEIVRYDLARDVLTKSAARLDFVDFSKGVFRSAAVWADGHAYVLGGTSSQANVAAVFQYDPTLDRVTLMQARLPSSRQSSGAIWTGQHVFIFGGYGPYPDPQEEIYRYDPKSDAMVTLNTTLPPVSRSFSGRAAISAVWTGTYALLFGGEQRTQGDSASDEILRFHPGPEPGTHPIASGATTTTSRSTTAGADDDRSVPAIGATALLVVLLALLSIRQRGK